MPKGCERLCSSVQGEALSIQKQTIHVKNHSFYHAHQFLGFGSRLGFQQGGISATAHWLINPMSAVSAQQTLCTRNSGSALLE